MSQHRERDDGHITCDSCHMCVLPGSNVATSLWQLEETDTPCYRGSVHVLVLLAAHYICHATRRIKRKFS